MSTKAAESYEHEKNRIPCKMCDGTFVPGGMKKQLPEGICAWCFYRGRLYVRYTALYDALQVAVAGHPVECPEKCCVIARLSNQIMNPSVSIQTSEEQP